MATERLTLRLNGRVQGVGLRYAIQKRASADDVRGYVQNLPDGSVAVVAEGGRDRLRAFLDWLKEPGQHWVITETGERWGPTKGGFTSFTIQW